MVSDTIYILVTFDIQPQHPTAHTVSPLRNLRDLAFNMSERELQLSSSPTVLPNLFHLCCFPIVRGLDASLSLSLLVLEILSALPSICILGLEPP